MGRNILLPLISLVSGLVCLYIDPRKDRARAWIVIGVLGASAVATGMYGYQDAKDAAKADTRADKQLDVAQNALDLEKAGQGTIAHLAQTVDTLLPRAHLPQTIGDESQSAQGKKEANPPVVEYFAKDIDGDAIVKAAKEAGFDVVGVPGQHPGSTNAMWVGDAVPLADTKVLALAVVRGGVQLRALRRFRDGTGLKSLLIQIGRDEAMTNAPVWTEDRIRALEALPPRS
jgi:type II secretory pathway pseudopilin PulG